MKPKAFIFALTIISVFFISCNNDSNDENRLDESRNIWLDFKTKSGNSYQYTTLDGSWVGVAWETTILVEKGVVVQRSFKCTFIDNNIDIPTGVETEWTENKENINTHQGASEALTLDEIYDKAKHEWLKKRNNTTTYLETKNNGMISLCGYADKDCADDCFVGVTIKEILTLP